MDVKTPLLPVEEPQPNNQNSVDLLKYDFLSKLPEKIRRGLDPEALFRFNFPTTPALAKGIPNVHVFVTVYNLSVGNICCFLRFLGQEIILDYVFSL